MECRSIEMKDLGDGWIYKELIGTILALPENGGPINYHEIQKRGEIVAEVANSNGKLVLTRDQHAHLLRLAQALDWTRLTPGNLILPFVADKIRTFMVDVEHAEKMEKPLNG